MNAMDFGACHIEYLCEKYESISKMATNEVPMSKDKQAIMRRAFKSYDKDGNGVLDRNEILDLLTNHYKEQGIKRKPTK